jgi:hypothetical protein
MDANAVAMTKQYPTLSSGYTQRLQQEAIRCKITDTLRSLNNCCPSPGAPLKIQGTSQTYTEKLQTCYTFTPVPQSPGCSYIYNGSTSNQPIGISPGGSSSSAHTRSLIDNITAINNANPETRFLAYKPYEYPVQPSTIIFTSPTVPVPAVDSCLLPGVIASGPIPISPVPTNVVETPFPGGFIDLSWTAGTDRSIVKYNIYVNGQLYATNVEATTYRIGPYPIFTTGQAQIEPVARNNWKAERSSIITWQILL